MSQNVRMIQGAPLGLGRPFLAPPGISADRLAALRAAIMATSNDPQFRVDCEKQHLECSGPKTSEQIDRHDQAGLCHSRARPPGAESVIRPGLPSLI